MVESPKLSDPENMTAELFEAITLICTFSGSVKLPALGMSGEAFDQIRRIFSPAAIGVLWDTSYGCDRLHFEGKGCDRLHLEGKVPNAQ